MNSKTKTQRTRRKPRWLEGDGAATAALLSTAFLSIAMMAMAAVTFWEARSRLAPNYIARSVVQSAILVEPSNSAQLQTVFAEDSFDLAKIREGRKTTPRIVIVRIPDDLESLATSDDKKNTMLQILLPAILLTNEELQRIRARLLRLELRSSSGLSLNSAQRDWLKATADRFGANMDSGTAFGPLLTELLQRVDIIPVELALAQGAIESGWGTARVALKGNAIFGQRTWTENNAVDAASGTEILYRSYDTVLEATRSYALNLNTHSAYDGFRKRRQEMRQSGGVLDAASLAGELLKYSERGQDYVDQIRTVIAVNKLTDFTQARLALN